MLRSNLMFATLPEAMKPAPAKFIGKWEQKVKMAKEIQAN